jgi:hypothetical protein
VTTAFSVGSIAIVLATPWLTDIFSPRRMFVASMTRHFISPSQPSASRSVHTPTVRPSGAGVRFVGRPKHPQLLDGFSSQLRMNVESTVIAIADAAASDLVAAQSASASPPTTAFRRQPDGAT